MKPQYFCHKCMYYGPEPKTGKCDTAACGAVRLTSLKQIEHEVLAHRYLYYVACEPLLADHEYDVLERAARAVLPDTSPVQGVGSSLPSSYSAKIVADAERRMGC